MSDVPKKIPGGAVYEFVFIESNVVPPEGMGKVAYLLVDDDIFPQQGTMWRPIMYQNGNTWRSNVLFFVDKLAELGEHRYGLDVTIMNDQTMQARMEYCPVKELYVPWTARLTLTREE